MQCSLFDMIEAVIIASLHLLLIVFAHCFHDCVLRFVNPQKYTEAVVIPPPCPYVPSGAHGDNPIASLPHSRAHSVVEALVGVLHPIEHAVAGEAVEAGVESSIHARKAIAFCSLRWPPSAFVHVSRRREDYKGRFVLGREKKRWSKPGIGLGLGDLPQKTASRKASGLVYSRFMYPPPAIFTANPSSRFFASKMCVCTSCIVTSRSFLTRPSSCPPSAQLRFPFAMVHGFRVNDGQQHSGVLFARRLARRGFTQKHQARLTKYLVTQETHVFVVGLWGADLRVVDSSGHLRAGDFHTVLHDQDQLVFEGRQVESEGGHCSDRMLAVLMRKFQKEGVGAQRWRRVNVYWTRNPNAPMVGGKSIDAIDHERPKYLREIVTYCPCIGQWKGLERPVTVEDTMF
ncbi:hypothetical protein KC356_g337 [Hortaea werneckii]|nr:hypothetical protein KC356_g337 [Hortaea werneckii]